MKFQLNIPSPCHENWDEFTPTSTGGFCGSCQKNVIDFSQMTEPALMAYFQEKSASKGHMCGRFRPDQLQKSYDPASWFPSWTASQEAAIFNVSLAGMAKEKTVFSLPLHRFKLARNISMAVMTLVFSETSFGQISGQITDNLGDPLPGVSIQIKGTKRGTSSNIDGKYTLNASPTDTLQFSFIGYETQALAGNDVKETIKMEEDVTGVLLGELVVSSYGNIMGKMALRTGGVSVCSVNSIQSETMAFPSKIATRVRVLGNPMVNTEVVLVPELDPFVLFADLNEKLDTENWIAQNGFQDIEKIEVYDSRGQVFPTDYKQIHDGRIVVNMRQVPTGLCFVRVTFSNERSSAAVEQYAVRVIVNR